MPPTISRDQFAQQVDSRFHVELDGGVGVDLMLTEVTPQMIQRAAAQSYESFSLFFSGPKEPVLPQKIYTLKHEVLGTLDLFLVPVGIDQRGAQYQAVFNRMLGVT
jgi:hypothetical protein